MAARKKTMTTYKQSAAGSMVDVPEGLVVYVEETELHYLNHTAAAVFLCCAIPLTEQQIAQILHEEFGLAEPPLAEVRTCLAELVKAGVLEAST